MELFTSAEIEDAKNLIIQIHQGVWTDDHNSKQLVFLSSPEGERAGNSLLVWRRERAAGASFPVTPCSTFLVDSMDNIEFVAPIETAIGTIPLSPGQPTGESLVTRFHASREMLISHDFRNYNEVVGDVSEAAWFVAIKDLLIEKASLDPYEGSGAPDSESKKPDAAGPDDPSLPHRYKTPN
ncbi:unnamed protein product [Clonostachys rosea]|uniref:PH domain-containing protein n=1 Tax=Bionectria ochroleuca TaxID=29856 RepID=A0ABY6UF69_BIOOC|nr:unnamed protein product [Clonostachys rosea]